MGLCHSEKHTRGAMKAHFRRRFARLTVRAAAQVRWTALQVVTGRALPAADGEFASERDAERASAQMFAYDAAAHSSCVVDDLPLGTKTDPKSPTGVACSRGLPPPRQSFWLLMIFCLFCCWDFVGCASSNNIF